MRLILCISLLLLCCQQATAIPNCISLEDNDGSQELLDHYLKFPDLLPVCYCDQMPAAAGSYKDQPLLRLSCLYGSVVKNLTDAINAVVAADRQVGQIAIAHMDFTGGIPKGLFQQMPAPNTLKVDISTCFVNGRTENSVNVSDNAFDGLEDILEELTFSDCNLESVPAQLAKMRNLKRLRLSIGITDLTKEHLDGLSQVTHLDIRDNNMKSVQPDAFEPMTSLVDLTLGPRNRFNDSIFVALNRLDKLESLNMNTVGLDELTDNQFVGMKSLTQIGLYRNNIVNISSGAFNGLDNVLVADLRLNALTGFEPGVFAPMKKLTNLLLGGNYFTEFDPEQLADIGDTLIELDLGFNELSAFGPNSFSTLPNLEILDLKSGTRYTRLSSMDVNAFTGLSKLKQLNLTAGDFSEPDEAGTSVSALPKDLFKPLTSLETLDLRNSKLPGITDGQLKSLTNLKYLNLQTNDIRLIPDNEFSDLGNLEYIDLSDNLWLCDDKFKSNVLDPVDQLYEIAAEAGRDFTWANSDNTLCNRPLLYQDSPVLSLNDTDWLPYDADADTTTAEPTTTTTPKQTIDAIFLGDYDEYEDDQNKGGISAVSIFIIIVAILVVVSCVLIAFVAAKRRNEQKNVVLDQEMETTATNGVVTTYSHDKETNGKANGVSNGHAHANGNAIEEKVITQSPG